MYGIFSVLMLVKVIWLEVIFINICLVIFKMLKIVMNGSMGIKVIRKSV